jgi:hypothetical protein
MTYRGKGTVPHLRQETIAVAGLSAGLVTAVLVAGALCAGLFAFSTWAPGWVDGGAAADTVQLQPPQPAASHKAHKRAPRAAAHHAAASAATVTRHSAAPSVRAPRAHRHTTAKRTRQPRSAVAIVPAAPAPPQPAAQPSVPVSAPPPPATSRKVTKTSAAPAVSKPQGTARRTRAHGNPAPHASVPAPGRAVPKKVPAPPAPPAPPAAAVHGPPSTPPGLAKHPGAGHGH